MKLAISFQDDLLDQSELMTGTSDTVLVKKLPFVTDDCGITKLINQPTEKYV